MAPDLGLAGEGAAARFAAVGFGPGPVSSDAHRSRLRSLVHLARAMSEPRPFDDLIELAAHEIRFALGADTVSIGRFERERGVIRVLVNVGNLGPHEEFRPEDETYQLADFPRMSLLIEEALPWVFDSESPSADPAAATLLERSGKAFSMAAPVLLDGRVWGEVYLTRAESGTAFTQDDVALVEALCAVMASGVVLASRVSVVERLAYEDPLTGLANRRAIDLRLEEALDARAGTGRPVSVIMADVNRLKEINDGEGHEAGDRVLIAVANAIAFAVSQAPSGLAGRIGGDEFCVVLDGVDGEAAVRLAQTVLDRLDSGLYPGALSCGISTTSSLPSHQSVSARQLLRWSDEAQYTAKRAALRVPVLAGRDTMALPATERRRLRGGGEEHVAAIQDGITHEALTLGLEAIDAAGHDPKLRLVALLDVVNQAVDGRAWVLSSLDLPSARSRTVAFAQSGESSRPECEVELAGEWLAAARTTGVLSTRGDQRIPLADARSVDAVAAAVVDGWMLEILATTDEGLATVPSLLRALGSVAVGG
jgi:diguanylate cyclase (GGDEF)-like protein